MNIFKENITKDSVINNIHKINLYVEPLETIEQLMIEAGYEVSKKESTKSKSGAKCLMVSNVSEKSGRNIQMVQVSPGGGIHGRQAYIKICTTTSDTGTIKIVVGDESGYNPLNEKKITLIFINRDSCNLL